MTLKVPEEVWVFGRGPSFDDVNRDTGEFAVTWYTGEFLVTINDMAFYVSNASMMFANDVVMQDRLFNTVRLTGRVRLDSHPIMVTRNNRLRFPFHLQHEAGGHGTAGYAVNVLSDLGARKFHMIGFDSYYGDYSYSKLFESKPQEPRIYDGILNYIKRIADEKKLEMKFYKKVDNQDNV